MLKSIRNIYCNLDAHHEKLKFNIYERKVKDTNKNQNTKFIGWENIESETGNLISFSTLEEIDGESIKFRENSVLFGKLRPYLAKVIKVDFRGSCTGELAVYEVGKKVNSQFLFYIQTSFKKLY